MSSYEDYILDYCEEHKEYLPCRECKRIREIVEHQKSHAESVARQKNRLKIAPWREIGGQEASKDD